MKNYLLITLGHNSSAIFVQNTSGGQKIIGYEQERFSRIKADSQFPIDAINEIEYNVTYDKMKGCIILISHWFNLHDDDDHMQLNKYLPENGYAKLMSYQPERIDQVNSKFTHHDAHCLSAHAFYKYWLGEDETTEGHQPVHYLVVDGFGNNKEVLSIYLAPFKGAKPKLLSRIYGYDYSLGLMYQYATSFVGMDENKDEYKFLGYEAHIDEYFDEISIAKIHHHIDATVKAFDEGWNTGHFTMPNCSFDTIDYKELNATKELWYCKFNEVIDDLKLKDHTSFEARVAIAYFIQQVCERSLTMLLTRYGVQRLVVAGGVFYNVKLNNCLMQQVEEFCVVPLAGDQGAAIGMLENEDPMDTHDFKFDHLYWGKRRLYAIEKYAKRPEFDGHIIVAESSSVATRNKLAKQIAQKIADGHIVNVVKGDMEFGPRALGHTTTYFLPTESNAALNNYLNNRNEVMPCAPIVSIHNAMDLFDDEELRKVVGSDRFMICTHNYRKGYSKQYAGVMHKVTLEEAYSGRPQIVDGTFEDTILRYVENLTDTKCLVNTSFNTHGNPIVFDTKDIYDNFKYQYDRADIDKKPYLFIIKNTASWQN